MMGRGGSWIGFLTSSLLAARWWYYQDFPAGSGPNLTLSQNDNGTAGTGAVWDSSRIVNGSAIATKTSGLPIYSNVAELPSQLVDTSSHVGTAVVLTQTPAAGEGTVRVWYLYAASMAETPSAMTVAPDFVTSSRAAFLDTRYLNADLNLSDLANAGTARTNLGFTAQTAGRVLLGDGGTTFTSDANLFFDTTNKRLGIGTSVPNTDLEVANTTTNSVIRLKGNGTAAGRFDLTATTGDAFTISRPSSGITAFGISSSDEVGVGTAGGITGSSLSVSNTAGDRIGLIVRGNAAQTVNLTEWQNSAGTVLSKVDSTGKGFFANLAITGLSTGIAHIDVSGNVTSSAVDLSGADVTGTLAAARFPALTGDVTTTAGSVATTIANSAVTNAKMANMPANTIKGNNTGAPAAPIDLTVAETTAMLNQFTTLLQGVVPASTNTTNFLQGGGWVDLPTSRTKAGKVTIASGVNSKAVSFATARANANYTPIGFLVNTVDTDPIHVPCLPIAISTTGFTMEWSDLLPTANYELYWAILEHYDP